MIKPILMLVLLIVAGCSPQVATELVMDPTLSPEQMASVIEAADDWCAHVPEFCVPISVGEDRGNGYVTHRAKCWEGVAGKTHQNVFSGPSIELCDDVSPMFGGEVARHELGHALTGFDDHHDNLGIMSVSLSIARLVNENDIAWATR